MSETRILTSMLEVRTLRVACTKCDAVQEIPADSRNMVFRCFNCNTEIPSKIQEAGEHILRAMKLIRDVPQCPIRLQLITTKDD
ncbi:MAG TPA: hypothetical protein P5533_00590 [Candidatus Cloacimonadota bacterium]|nr:hypothetical protein [Candidatus Cloacimonadota bacterium]